MRRTSPKRKRNRSREHISSQPFRGNAPMSEQGGVALRDVAPFWLQHKGFITDRTATFESEFARLAEYKGWKSRTRKKQLVEAATSELVFRRKDVSRLDESRMLCEEVGITGDFSSITQCRKVSCAHLYRISDKADLLQHTKLTWPRRYTRYPSTYSI